MRMEGCKPLYLAAIALPETLSSASMGREPSSVRKLGEIPPLITERHHSGCNGSAAIGSEDDTLCLQGITQCNEAVHGSAVRGYSCRMFTNGIRSYSFTMFLHKTSISRFMRSMKVKLRNRSRWRLCPLDLSGRRSLYLIFDLGVFNSSLTNICPK